MGVKRLYRIAKEKVAGSNPVFRSNDKLTDLLRTASFELVAVFVARPMCTECASQCVAGPDSFLNLCPVNAAGHPLETHTNLGGVREAI